MRNKTLNTETYELAYQKNLSFEAKNFEEKKIIKNTFEIGYGKFFLPFNIRSSICVLVKEVCNMRLGRKQRTAYSVLFILGQQMFHLSPFKTSEVVLAPMLTLTKQR